MNPLAIANRYMQVFYGGESLDSLTDILAENLIFEGPFFRFESAADYIAALVKDPPENIDYEIVDSYENATSACLLYYLKKADPKKPAMTTPVAQRFEVTGDKITHILIVFDKTFFGDTQV